MKRKLKIWPDDDGEAVRELHQSAMEHTDLAIAAQRRGNEEEALNLYSAAFNFERQAAQALSSKFDAEPTRSILHRSAATLALDCGQYRDAEILICEALRGMPPEGIAEELRDLLEQVYSASRSRGAARGPLRRSGSSSRRK